jgi:murein DD-endopeptidase MepM/ murein hydrolase activator NlpD
MKIGQEISAPHINLEALKGRNDPEAIKAAAKEIESLFAYELVKAMRATSSTGSDNSLGKDVYMGMFDMELSKLLAERGLGLQDVLLRGLNRNNYGQNVKSMTTPLTDKKQSINPDLAQRPSALPVDGIVSSPFGMRKHPVHGDVRFHHGLDIAAPDGTDIFPVRNGKVIFSGQQPGYGNVVVVDHGDGFISKYAHNKVNMVQEGEDVDFNTIIGQVGSTGTSTGPHLHFEVRYQGNPVNPVQMMAQK